MMGVFIWKFKNSRLFFNVEYDFKKGLWYTGSSRLLCLFLKNFEFFRICIILLELFVGGKRGFLKFI